MFRIILFLSISLIVTDLLKAQSCLPDGKLFTTQTEIDAFPSNYPGCKKILGHVRISGWNSINNLAGLSQIESIGGNLSIDGNDSLTTLSGLNNLNSIDNLTITYNLSLNTLAGLDNLSFIKRGIDIRNNDTLATLKGLENLTSINGDLSISNNTSLITLEGLENLTSIGAILNISNNTMLKTLKGLKNLTSIGEFFRISYNDSLSNLAGLNNLTTIGEWLGIIHNTNIKSLTGLDNLNSIGGDLFIVYNSSLINLEGFDNLNSINGLLWISDNQNLIDISSLKNIDPEKINSSTSDEEDVLIFNNPVLFACSIAPVCDAILKHNATTDIRSNANGCNSQTEVVSACISYVNSDYIKSSLTLNQNPVNEMLKFNSTKVQDIYIYNGFGILVRQLSIFGEYNVDVRDLLPGLYYIKSEYGELIKFVKL